MRRVGEVFGAVPVPCCIGIAGALLVWPGAVYAQDWTWGVRLSAGFAAPTGSEATIDDSSALDLSSGPILTVDERRFIAATRCVPRSSRP